MRIVVLGGYGLIGSHVVAHLLVAGHAVVGAGRDVAVAARRFPGMPWLRLDLAHADAATWATALAGADVVVNCAGALQDGLADSLQAVHVDGLRRLLEGARAAGITRFIHISAAGVATSPGAFGATKRAAEAVLAASDMDWIVLRPGLVLAPTAFGGSALLRALAGFPLAIPAIHADSPVQVIGVEDVAAAVLAATRPDLPGRIAIDLVAAGETSLADILRALRAWLGLAPAPLLVMPGWVARLGAGLADGLAWLGWRSPMRSNAMAQLAAGIRGDATAAGRHLGLRPQPLEAWLATRPAGVQEAWFARLYLMKPVLFATLAAFWLASGLAGMAQIDRAAAVLAPAGFAPGLARLAVVLGSVADLALGLLVCHRRSARLALYGMLAVTGAYLLGATAWRPDLWADPLGPLVKVVPCALLAVVGLAVLEER